MRYLVEDDLNEIALDHAIEVLNTFMHRTDMQWAAAFAISAYIASLKKQDQLNASRKAA